MIKFVCTNMLEYVNVDFKVLQLYTCDCKDCLSLPVVLVILCHPRQLNRQILMLKRGRTKDHKVLSQDHIWFWFPLRGFRWVNELQSMASQHGSHHKFVAWRKRSPCFMEFVVEIFSLGEFYNLPNFLPPMCSCMNSPNFPTVKVSLRYVRG